MTRRLGRAGLLGAFAVLGACSSAGGAPAVGSPSPPTVTAPPTPVDPVNTAATGTTGAATAGSATSTTATITPTTSAATTTTRPTTTPYVVPVEPGVKISYAHVHAGYTATDIFASTGCGTPLVSPVNGQVIQVRRTDTWTKEADNPALRGGLSVAILGDDGVRYYLAHLQQIDDGIVPRAEVSAGQRLGEMGDSGHAGACHVHFGISMPCPGPEWSIRRGVVWPWPYLDSWRSGGQASPQLEIVGYALAHPDACATAMSDVNAPLSG